MSRVAHTLWRWHVARVRASKCWLRTDAYDAYLAAGVQVDTRRHLVQRCTLCLGQRGRQYKLRGWRIWVAGQSSKPVQHLGMHLVQVSGDLESVYILCNAGDSMCILFSLR